MAGQGQARAGRGVGWRRTGERKGVRGRRREALMF